MEEIEKKYKRVKRTNVILFIYVALSLLIQLYNCFA